MSNASKNDLNKEYIYVRRLISVLTNDDSDKLIVEKLKGKNLSSLMYNAKIIDHSKNMTANKKILACVIRAIEREKHLCQKRELEQSWGRKFLSSFNCLYPLRSDDDGFLRCERGSSKVIKHRALSRRTKTSSTRMPKTSCRNSFKKCDSSMRDMKPRITDCLKSYPEKITKRAFSCVGSISTEKDCRDDLAWPSKIQQFPIKCVYKLEKMLYATVCPLPLRPKKLNCVVVYPGRPLPAIRRVEEAEKKSSSTQTPEPESDPELKEPNNIKLQNLLEAASNLINTQDQREYVRSFLSNFEPPFDLSAGFPPYLKLPMKKSEDLVGKESVYGTNSELSIRSDLLDSQPQIKDVIKQKEDNVRKYVRDLVCDPWQDTAESIISGVINESLPHEKADYSQLGACILKRLGAYPVSSTHHDPGYRRPNLNIPEIILQCTEFFETDAGDSEHKHEPKEPKQEVDKSPSIIEMTLLGGAKSSGGQNMQNYCFYDGDNAEKDVGLLNLSQSSLVDVGTQDNNQDRKNLQLRKPLKITPSGLEQGGKKPKRGIFERRWESKTAKEGKRAPMNLIGVKSDGNDSPKRPQVSIYTLTSEKKHETIGPGDHQQETFESKAELDRPPIECKPVMKPEQMATPDKSPQTVESNHAPPEPNQTPMAAVETFDGVGEGQTELTPTRDKKQLDKGKFPEKFRGKKKCKVSKKKADSRTVRNEVDSRNCRVM